MSESIFDMHAYARLGEFIVKQIENSFDEVSVNSYPFHAVLKIGLEPKTLSRLNSQNSEQATICLRWRDFITLR